VAPDRFSQQDSRLASSALRGRARPYILRRRKEDVLQELPLVIDREEVIELAPAQIKAYDVARRGAGKIRREKGEALRLVNELLRICDYAPDGHTSTKLDRIAEHMGDIRERGEKAVVFSNFLEPLRILRTILNQRLPATRTEMVTGEMSVE